MNNIESRIEKLEQQRPDNRPTAAIVYVSGESSTEAEAEAAKQKAILDYKANHPSWEPSHRDLCIQVLNEHAKELTERIIAGERT